MKIGVISWLLKNKNPKIIESPIDPRIADDSELLSIYKRLENSWGFAPSYNDVKWSKLNRERLANAKNRDWGLYRNNTLEMANQLRKEGKDLESLKMYFEVNDLDINGCENTGGSDYSEAERRKYGIKDFDPEFSGIFLGAITTKLIQRLNLSDDEAKEIYLETLERVRVGLPMPFTISESWDRFLSEVNRQRANEEFINNFNFSDIGNLIEEIRKDRSKLDNTVYNLVNKFRLQFRGKKTLRDGRENIERVIKALLEKEGNRSIGENTLIYFLKRDTELFQSLVSEYIEQIKRTNRSWRNHHFVNRTKSLLDNIE